jgi:hypothetical protein
MTRVGTQILLKKNYLLILDWYYYSKNVDVTSSNHADIVDQLRNVYCKLESDLQSSKKGLSELADQCDELKKGREESVSPFHSVSY